MRQIKNTLANFSWHRLITYHIIPMSERYLNLFEINPKTTAYEYLKCNNNLGYLIDLDVNGLETASFDSHPV